MYSGCTRTTILVQSKDFEEGFITYSALVPFECTVSFTENQSLTMVRSLSAFWVENCSVSRGYCLMV